MFRVVVPMMIEGVVYTPESSSTLVVSIPVEQNISVSRGVITRYDVTITEYENARVRQHDNLTSGLGNESYCLEDGVTRTLRNLSFDGLSEL